MEPTNRSTSRGWSPTKKGHRQEGDHQDREGIGDVFALDENQELSEQTAFFDALVRGIEGELEVKIEGTPYSIVAGRATVMPAGKAHALMAPRQSRMVLTMIRGGPLCLRGPCRVSSRIPPLAPSDRLLRPRHSPFRRLLHPLLEDRIAHVPRERNRMVIVNTPSNPSNAVIPEVDFLATAEFSLAQQTVTLGIADQSYLLERGLLDTRGSGSRFHFSLPPAQPGRATPPA